MNKHQKISLVLLRTALGFLFLYSGISKVLDSTWSAAGYLQSAKTFPWLFHWFASAQNIGWINFVNEWGMLLIGVCLILGVAIRWAALGGMLLMVMYYLPILQFPYIAPHSLLVDEHVMYFLVFVVLYAFRKDRLWSVNDLLHHRAPSA